MWIETIVMPREEPAEYRPAPQRDRAAGHAAACAMGEQFRDSVLSYLQSHELMGSVRWVSDPGSIPLVTLYCTSSVLEQLQKEPRFEAGRALAFTTY
ncbi:hypothetical protein [Archangium sp.]|uniref:hypothetical protein n=1 Tax=Archangium sp. TaxID=1872627 RepID=UPI002D5898BD|nr:hypothetical protein [Archangium sp.]HYO59416.1 hypothetical protein [Archangium sp.]